MSVISLLNFVQKHGEEGLLTLLELLNMGIPHKRIAEKFRMDAGQLSRFIGQNIETKYILRMECHELINKLAEIRETRILATAKERAKVLELVTRQKDRQDKEETG